MNAPRPTRSRPSRETRAPRARTAALLVGRSAVIESLRREMLRVAQSDAKVLVTGESGVGKEIVARGIHALGPRAPRPFAPVNCAGLPDSLLESELFGHVRGSFTGAIRDKPGKLETANRGTVFLDEVGEMTLRMQGLLLRFLETGELQKVGADDMGRPVDVRVIAATNRKLRDLVEQGLFREDLFYRLNVIQIVVPPLRDRREDIPLLAGHALDRLKAAGRSAVEGISPEAMRALEEYSWPGNVRELENVIERAVVTSPHETIGLDDLPPELRALGPLSPPLRERRRSAADELFARMTERKESFWSAVYPLFMSREITRGTVREIVRRGLETAHGNYKIVVWLFNMQPREYKRFLNFLRKHDCGVSFKEYR